ncbi:MAG: NADH-quinone oxidoreductase subunit M [Burkholderiales bacterium]|nr:NADH-quinone oxidoreductase subunit M [Phycisphaerae bacterium]
MALLLLILFPFAGAIFAASMKVAQVARVWTLLISFLTFALALVVAGGVMDKSVVTWGTTPGVANPLAISDIGLAARLSCDGISIWLVLLTTFIVPLVVVSVGPAINDRADARWFYTWVLVLLGSLLGAFIAADGLLFYFFFELTLVPSLFMIAIWGGADRRAAAGRFFIYTFAGSIFLLIGLIYLAAQANSFEMSRLIWVAQNDITSTERWWIGLAFLVGFLIKTPVFPLHSWQPLTYAESPSPAAALIAALMSKLGTYGLLRLAIPIGFVGPTNNGAISQTVIVLCLIGIVYGGLIAWVQKDAVRLIAYSSLSHLALCVLAMFAALANNASTTLSLQGAVMYMIAHGLSTAALLLVIGAIYARAGTRNLTEISGLFAKMPVLSTLLVIFTMASIGLPITSGFVGEILSLQGVLNGLGFGVAAIAALGMILGAIYMLHMVASIGFGPLKAPAGAVLTDATDREMAALLPLVAAVLALGIMPTPVLESFKDEVAAIAHWSPTVLEDNRPQQTEEPYWQ